MSQSAGAVPLNGLRTASGVLVLGVARVAGVGGRSPPSPTSSVSSSMPSSSSVRRRGASREAATVSGSSSSVTPDGMTTAESGSVSPMFSSDTSRVEHLGDLVRERLDGDLAQRLVEHAAVADARRVLGADELDRDDGLDRLAQVDAQEVHVRRLTAHRVVLGVLEHGGACVLPSSDSSTTAPDACSACRRSRASTANGSGSPPRP